MKKKIIALTLIVFSCKNVKNPDPCGCAFNIDLTINKDKSLDEYRKFLDIKTLEDCKSYAESSLKINRDITVEEIYNFYKITCPSYDLEVKKN